MTSAPENLSLADFSRLGTGQVSDAMELLGLKRTVLLGLAPVGSYERTIVGRAVTLEQRRKAPGSPRDISLVRHREVSDGLAGKGDFVVIATGGIVDIATWGDNHSLRCRSNHVAGMLTDGAVRDAASIRSTGFPVFCAGYSPVKSQWDLETVAINAPVRIAGVPIAPGDYVFADESGIVIVPAAQMGSVVEKALAILDRETRYQADLARREP